VLQARVIIANQAFDVQPTVSRHQTLRGLDDRRLANVKRPVGTTHGSRLAGFQQVVGFARRAAAELENMIGPACLDYGLRVRGQQSVLGARDIILGRGADSIEQLRPDAIVEILRRQTARSPQ
jgi:hypothetical protein